MNPKLLGSLLLGVIVLTGVYIGTLSLKQQPVTQNIVQDQLAQVGSTLPSGQIAYWSFDGGSGTTVSDSVGGNTLSFVGSPTWVNGRTGGNALSFAGTGQALRDSSIAISSPAVTVSFWMNNAGWGTAQTELVELGDNSNNSTTGFGIYVNDTPSCTAGQISVAIKGDAGYNAACYATPGAGAWHHYAFVLDKSQSGTGEIKVYMDGALQNPAKSLFTADNTNSFGTNSLNIMSRSGEGSPTFAGILDDMRLYSRALSFTEVSQLVSYTGAPAVDTTAPVISNVSSSAITQTSATVSWSTNESANSIVTYGLTTAYGSNSAVTTGNSVTLTGLTANTVYNYKIVSKDALNNTSESANYTFTTAKPVSNATPTVSLSLSSSAITLGNSVTITADAKGTDGTVNSISTVDFYNGAPRIGHVVAQPFTYTWTPTAVGTYSLSAIAYDKTGVSVVTPTPLKTVTVTNTPTTNPTLTITKSGTGAGLVSTPSGITGAIYCGTTCSGTMPSGQSVVLKATPDANSTFGGWSGCTADATNSAQCTFNITANKAVTATFNKIVNTTNPSVTLTASPTSVTAGTPVTLTWTPVNTTSCTGTGFTATNTTGSVQVSPTQTTTYSISCPNSTGVNVTSSVTVTVTPVQSNYTVTIVKPTSNTGTGTVTSAGAINCGTACSSTGTAGMTVTLTATPASGSTFDGWTGGCTGTTNPCSFVLNANTTVNAVFSAVVNPPPTGTTINVTPSTWSSLSFTRGYTYILAPGTYTSKTLDTPASGSQLITIKGSGTGQAQISYLIIGSSYWVIDGVTGAGASVIPADTNQNNYGFYITANSHPIQLTGNLTDITIKHTRFYTNVAGSTGIYQADVKTGNKNNVTISYSLFDGFNEFIRNGVDTWNNTLLEYSVILNSQGNASFHGNAVNAMWAPLVNMTIRYNVFKDMVGDGISGIISGNNSDLGPILVYGNVFDNIPHCTYVVGANSGYGISNSLFYNNTVINSCTDDPGFPVLGRNQGSNNVARNNLYYNGVWNSPYSMIWNGDYDAWYSTASAPGSHAFVGTGNPFVNYSGMDYRPKANTPAGISLVAPYGFDATGKARTTWTRGAFEYTGTVNPTVNVPPTVTLLSSPTTAVTPATFNLTASASDSDGTVSKVDFYNGTTLIGTDTTSPYTLPYTQATVGTYTITAKATDNSGAVTTSNSVSISVTSAPIANSTTFITGDRVKTTDTVNVRASASLTATLLGTQATSSLGTILGGGTSSDGYYWWNINYDTGVDGYSAENWLQKYVAPVSTYTITTSAGTNGTITPTATGITSGTSKTITISANTGYQVSGVTVDGVSVGAVTSYTFSNITANHTISATFTAVPSGTVTSCTGVTNCVNVTPSTWSSLSFTRGYTYILAPGTYTAKTLDTPASGSQLITIKGSGTGQVVIPSLNINSSYWTIDGVTGNGFSVMPPDRNPANYGIKFTSPTAITYGTSGEVTLTNITIKHVYAAVDVNNAAAAGDGYFFGIYNQGYSNTSISNLTIGYSYFYGWGQALNLDGKKLWTNVTWEYNIYEEMFTSPTYHGNPINVRWAPVSNLVVRYSLFYHSYGTGGLSQVIAANNEPITNSKIYGNVFDQAWSGRATISGNFHGTVGSPKSTDDCVLNTVVYNNTFLLSEYQRPSAPGVGGLIGEECASIAGNVFKNNLAYKTRAQTNASHDYNEYIATENAPSASGSDIITSTDSDPFVSWSTKNYARKTNSPGINLGVGSEYGFDATGKARTTWTRGAFEF